MAQSKAEEIAKLHTDMVLRVGEMRLVPTLTGDCNFEIADYDDGCGENDDVAVTWHTSARSHVDLQRIADYLFDMFDIVARPKDMREPENQKAI